MSKQRRAKYEAQIEHLYDQIERWKHNIRIKETVIAWLRCPYSIGDKIAFDACIIDFATTNVEGIIVDVVYNPLYDYFKKDRKKRKRFEYGLKVKVTKSMPSVKGYPCPQYKRGRTYIVWDDLKSFQENMRKL